MSKVSRFISFEPIATLAATNVLGDSIVAALAYSSGWSAKAIIFITLIWHNAVNVVGSLLARASVTPNSNVVEVANGKAAGIINDLVTMQQANVAAVTAPVVTPPIAS